MLPTVRSVRDPAVSALQESVSRCTVPLTGRYRPLSKRVETRCLFQLRTVGATQWLRYQRLAVRVRRQGRFELSVFYILCIPADCGRPGYRSCVELRQHGLNESFCRVSAWVLESRR